MNKDSESEGQGAGAGIIGGGLGGGLGEWSVTPNPPVNLESNQEPDSEVLNISISSDENDVFLSFSEKHSEDDGTKLSLSQISSVEDPEDYVAISGANANPPADKREDDQCSLDDVSDDDEGICDDSVVTARASVNSVISVSGYPDISLIEPDVDVTMVTASLIDEVSGCDIHLDDENGNKIPPVEESHNSAAVKDALFCKNEDLDSDPVKVGKDELENIASNQEYQNLDTLSSSRLSAVDEVQNAVTNLNPGIGKEENGEDPHRLDAGNENGNQKDSDLKVSENLKPSESNTNVDDAMKQRKSLSPIKWKKSPTKPVDKELAQSVLDRVVNKARFFLIKSCNNENIAISKSESIWATGHETGFKLHRALSKSDNVILFLSVNLSQKFAGFARIVRETSPRTHKSVKWVGKGNEFPYCFELDWISRCELEFYRTKYVQNKWNFYKPVKVGRDGQEIDPKSGAMLASLFAIDANTDWKSIAEHLKGPGVSSPEKQHLENAGTDKAARNQMNNSESAATNPGTGETGLRALATSTPVRTPSRLREDNGASFRKRRFDADFGHSPAYKRSRSNYQYEGPYSWKDVCAWGSQHTWHSVPPAPPMPFPPPPPFDIFPPPRTYWPTYGFEPSHMMGNTYGYEGTGGPYY